MFTATESLELCPWLVKPHKFNKSGVKCALSCKKEYKTYTGLHQHYLEKHKICIHRVAELDPNNEDEFRRRLTEYFTPPTGEGITSQGSQRGCATPHANQPLFASPSPQIAGPSQPRGYQTPGDAAFHLTAGQSGLLNSPSWALPTPVKSPYQNHRTDPRTPVSGEVGPSRSPPVYPTARHQPYPQSRPHQQGLYTSHSPIRDRSKGKGRDIPPTATNNGLPAPDTLSRGNCLELPTPTTRPHGGMLVEPPQYPSTCPPYARSQQAVAGTSIPTQLTLVPQCPTNTTVTGAFREPATAQEYNSPVNPLWEPEDSMPTAHVRPAQICHQQLPAIVIGSHDPAMYVPTPPMSNPSLPGGFPCPVSNQPECSPRRVNQNRRSVSLTPATSGTPSPRHTAQSLVSYPYPRPVHGSTTSQLAQQARQNRQQGSSTGAGAAEEMFAHNAPHLEEKQTQAMADIQHPVPDRYWEQNYTTNVTPGLSGAQEKEPAILLTDRHNYSADHPIEPSPSHVRLPNGRVLSQQQEPTPIGRPTIPKASATASQGKAKPRESRQVNDGQRSDESSATWKGPTLPERCESVQAQKQSDSAVPGPVGQPPAADEPTQSVLIVREPSQELTPVQRRNSDKRRPATTPNEAEALREQKYVQDPISGISWEGWGLVKAPGGTYLPETFNPPPHTFEDLTDQRRASKESVTT